MQSKAKTVPAYLASLPSDRRTAIEAVRKVILKNLPKGYEEEMNWGAITYCIPLSRYPNTYNGQPLAYAALASQANYMSVYLMGVYGDPKVLAQFEKAYRAAGRKLDMGKSCVRFKKLEDLPLSVIGETIARVSVEAYLKRYEEMRAKKK